MLEINVKPASGSFTLYRNRKIVLTVAQSGWRDGYAASLYNDQELEICHRGLTGNRFEVLKKEIVWGQIYSNWVGRYIIRLTRSDGNGEDIFTLKPRGLVNEYFDLFYEAHDPVLTLKAAMTSSHKPRHYSVRELKHDFPDIAINELLIYCGFCANLYFANFVVT